MSNTTNDDKNRRENEPQSKWHEEAQAFREEFAGQDPYEDRDAIRRSFPNQVDQSGTPDTQPHQPAEALGEGQVSIDSVKKESEELDKQADRKATPSERRSGVRQVSAEEQKRAEAKAKE